MSELLLPHSGIGEMRLLAPALSALQRLGGRGVMLFDPPGTPCAWTLSALGIDLQQLVVVRSAAGVVGSARASSRRPPEADLLWALEHTLKSGQAGAVLAWLPPRLRAEPLRRLQLAAQAHEGPAFLMREIGCRDRPSASPLRLALAPASADELLISVFKRRGPPLQQPLLVELHPVLSDPEKRRARRLPPLEVEVAALSLPLRA